MPPSLLRFSSRIRLEMATTKLLEVGNLNVGDAISLLVRQDSSKRSIQGHFLCNVETI